MCDLIVWHIQESEAADLLGQMAEAALEFHDLLGNLNCPGNDDQDYLLV